MKYRIMLFATLKMKAGSDSLDVEVPGDSATVADVISAAVKAKPQLESSLRTMVVAVNKEFANKDQVVSEGDAIAFFPPVSGG